MAGMRGFTLMELMLTLAIVGTVYAVGSGTGMSGLGQKKTAQNTNKELQDQLAMVRNEAMNRNRTSKILISVSSSQVYTITTQISSVATNTCTSAGTWSTIATKEINVHDNYTISGTSVATPLCFYRDGSSSSGAYTIAPNSGFGGTTYTLIISIATGYIDVSES